MFWPFKRKKKCNHVCNLWELHTVSENPKKVAATCMKCGAVLEAPCGLDLDCEWVQKRTTNMNEEDHE